MPKKRIKGGLILSDPAFVDVVKGQGFLEDQQAKRGGSMPNVQSDLNFLLDPRDYTNKSRQAQDASTNPLYNQSIYDTLENPYPVYTDSSQVPVAPLPMDNMQGSGKQKGGRNYVPVAKPGTNNQVDNNDLYSLVVPPTVPYTEYDYGAHR